MLIAKTFSFWQQNFAILLSSTHSLTFMHNSVASKFIIVQERKSLRQKNFPGARKGKNKHVESYNHSLFFDNFS
jgi:hypothetical protein